jgi:hypothetical protein
MAIGGVGIGLTSPSLGFPSSFGNNAVTQALGTNYIDLPAGGAVVLPAGNLWVYTGKYSFLQFFDPVMQVWISDSTTGERGRSIMSDGVSYRVFNPLGTPVGAIMTATGTTYKQATTNVTASTGGSTWRPVVGGSISTTITITSGGANYTYRPLLDIDAPPTGGVPASAACTVSGGAINAVTVLNQGGGYKNAPNIRVRPHPLDPNFASITPAVLTAALVTGNDATGVAAVLCTSPGTVLTTAPTLTITGGDGNATAVAIMALTVTGVSFSNSGGAGYGGSAVNVDVNGGFVTNAASSIVNPRVGPGLFTPRKAIIYAPVATGAVGTAVIVDGGIFQVAPTGNVIATSTASAGLPSTATAATLTLGSVADRVLIQPM